MDVFPFWEAVKMVFQGSGDCAKIDWTFLGISMAGWVLISLVGLASIAAWNNSPPLNRGPLDRGQTLNRGQTPVSGGSRSTANSRHACERLKTCV
jgi:hypothetical protein